MFKYEVSHNESTIQIKITTAIGSEHIIYFDKKSPEEVVSNPWFTATTQMKDFIGNVKSINGNKCTIEGFYEGSIRIFPAIIVDQSIKSLGDRVMITEHLNVDGYLCFLASKKRILEGDLNFINVGWSTNGEIKRYMRIDVYLAQTKEIKV